MTRLRSLVLAAVGLAAVATTVGSSASEAAPIDPVCRAVLEPASRGDIYPSSPPRTNVGFRLRCNIEVGQVLFRTTKRLERVFNRPSLERSDSGDELECDRLSRAVGRCLGRVGDNTRILGAIRVPGGACRAERLGALFRVQGGRDCHGEPCTDEGYEVVIRVEEPRGC